MKKVLKKMLAASCVAMLLLTVPGMLVFAEEMQVEDVELPDNSLEFEDKEPFEDDLNQNLEEEVVGEGIFTVCEGVNASFDENTGEVEFYSHGGTLDRNWYENVLFGYGDNIKSIKVVSGTIYLPSDSNEIFGNMPNLKNFDSNGFDTSNVTNMSFMFSDLTGLGCDGQLHSLDLSAFDTTNVTQMDGMFSGCRSLSTLELSSFDTSNVTNMASMFQGCGLSSLELNSFDTSNVTDMRYMFNGCGDLTTLDLSSFDTSNVTDMGYMFDGCQNLTTLDLNSFDTSNVTDMTYMFWYCIGLSSLDLSSFDTSNVTDMNYMFYYCKSLTDLDLSSFDTSNVTDMGGMFWYCIGLSSLNLSSFNTSNVTYMGYMFSGCSSLSTLNLSSFDTSNVTDMTKMFSGCSCLLSLNLSTFDTSSVTDMFGMFKGCINLSSLDLSSFDTLNTSDESYQFEDGHFGMFPGTDKMLYDCSSLRTLKTPKMNSRSVDLPAVMYDESGNEYTALPVTNKSMTLRRATNLSGCTVKLSETSFIYNGSAITPTVTVQDGDDTLQPDTNYIVSYADNINAGTATATVTGKGNYTGKVSKNFTINKAAASLKFASATVEKTTLDATFTNELTKTTDGTVTFKSSDTGVATVDRVSGLVTIKGVGMTTITATATAGTNYKEGSAIYTLTVVDGRVDLSACTVTLSATSYTYNGNAKKPNVTVKNGSATLIAGTDYIVSYKDNTNAGTAKAIVTGMGNYTGTNSKNFTIKKAAPSLKFAEYEIKKSTLDEAFTNELTKKTDGDVTFTSNDTAVAVVDRTSGLVTIKGKGTAVITATAVAGKNYKAGNVPYTLIVEPVSVENASVAGVSLSYGYSGKAYTPEITVTVDGVTLTKDTDYTVKYENNKNPGTAKITITGKEKYTGTRIKNFEIVDCVSSLVSGKTYQLIPKNNSKTAACSYSGKMVNNTKVYITDRSSSEAMKFKAIKNSDGTWKFINAKCELALAVQQNSSEVGRGTVLYDQTTKKAQNWKLSKKSDNSFAIMNAVTGYSIAMSDASAVKGTTLSMAETASSGLQRFYIAETTAVNTPFDGTYGVKASKDKRFALNIASSSKDDGANVNLYTYSNTNAKKFKVMYSGGGYYRLVNVNSGLCLTVKGNTKTDGANVIQSKWAADSGQRWKITKNSDGTVTISNALGTVLHLSGNKTANGTNIIAKTASTSKAQKWYLE